MNRQRRSPRTPSWVVSMSAIGATPALFTKPSRRPKRTSTAAMISSPNALHRQHLDVKIWRQDPPLNHAHVPRRYRSLRLERPARRAFSDRQTQDLMLRPLLKSRDLTPQPFDWPPVTPSRLIDSFAADILSPPLPHAAVSEHARLGASICGKKYRAWRLVSCKVTVCSNATATAHETFTAFPSARTPDASPFLPPRKNLRLDVINVDLRGGETKTPEFLGKNPSDKIPVWS